MGRQSWSDMMESDPYAYGDWVYVPKGAGAAVRAEAASRKALPQPPWSERLSRLSREKEGAELSPWRCCGCGLAHHSQHLTRR
eukprot:8271480-Alexandrium_andersonii.AAC.1